MDTNLGRGARRGPRGPYRHHSIEFKRAVVEQSLQPGASVSLVAREHDVNANQVFTWRRAYMRGELGETGFMPVVLAESDDARLNAHDTPRADSCEAMTAALGRLTVERNGARLTVEGCPDAQALAQVLAALLR